MPSPTLLPSGQSSESSGVRDAWPPELMGHSALVRRARELVRSAADPAARALIVAEPGLDAGLVAETIHGLGSPPGAPLVEVDCAGPAGPLEATLLGPALRRGRRSELLERIAPDSMLAAARGGTLFLANVSELPASVQERLARIARDGEVRSAEAGGVVPLGLRLIGSCGPSIDTEVADGAFREDLHRRMSAVRIEVPPLRLRPEDIPSIARHLAISNGSPTGSPLRFTIAALGFLSALPWEGNLRELAEVIERLAARAPAPPARVEDVLGLVRLDRPLVPSRLGSLREARRQFEREYIAAVLRRYGWRMGEAAKALGIQRTNLYRKARQLKIARAKVKG